MADITILYSVSDKGVLVNGLTTQEAFGRIMDENRWCRGTKDARRGSKRPVERVCRRENRTANEKGEWVRRRGIAAIGT